MICRYDKDGITPYLSINDFPNLHLEKSSFLNSKNIRISYFIYNYDNYDKEKVIVFSHGIGPGHTAYLSEINTLCEKGFRVIAYDYTGCGESEGSSLMSINEPSRDLDDLLNHLAFKEEVILIGHSLGGYTTLNIANRRADIKKAIIMSPFLSIQNLMTFLLKSRLFAKQIVKYEASIEKYYLSEDNLNYLSKTDDKLLFVHSKDDPVVGYLNSVKLVEDLNNPNLSFVIVDGKGHNPNYSDEAIKYLRETFREYNKLVKKKKLKTFEDKKGFMKDKSPRKMTIQDEEIISKIVEFIKGN